MGTSFDTKRMLHTLTRDGILARADRLKLAEELRALIADRDGAYHERNMVLSLAARLAVSAGYKAGLLNTVSDDPEWSVVCYLDLPAGQVSWHLRRDEVPLFSFLPAYEGAWDGHTTTQKYHRVLHPFSVDQQAPSPPTHGEQIDALIEHARAAFEESTGDGIVFDNGRLPAIAFVPASTDEDADVVMARVEARLGEVYMSTLRAEGRTLGVFPYTTWHDIAAELRRILLATFQAVARGEGEAPTPAMEVSDDQR